MLVDPVVSLASSLQAAPGTFALLVGSGISRSVQIPTGWNVALDLVRRIALLTDGVEPDDPLSWFETQSGGVSYSDLLEQLAPNAADRRNLLNGYFEPTHEEREQGVKAPTRAHRAIAQIVADGYVRVIVTTNFDRLLEAALRGAGVEPVVISSAAAAAGATPLAHSRCTLVKVHGDYLDPDLKNTISELDHYDAVIDRLLDRVFDEYGLVVCGWSGEWDEALRAALLRAPNRRYGVWWARVGSLGDRAAQLVAHRGAIEVPIIGADEFFETVAGKVSVLAEARDRRPLSTAIALAELKRYLPDPVHRIRLHDLITGEVDHVLAVPVRDPNTPRPTEDNVSERMREFEAACATLVSLVATMAYFADRDEHDRLLVTVIRRLALRPRTHGGYTVWINLELYPALLGLYALGLGALAQGRLSPLTAALTEITVPHPDGDEALVVEVCSWKVLDAQICNSIIAEPNKRQKTSVSDYLHNLLRELVRPVISSTDDYADLFDQLEYLLGVVSTGAQGRGPVGRFAWRDRYGYRERIFNSYTEQLLAGGLFEGQANKLDKARTDYNQIINEPGSPWW